MIEVKKLRTVFFKNFLINNKIKQYSKNSLLGAVFAERFTRAIRDLLKRPVVLKGDSIWIDILPTITKKI